MYSDENESGKNFNQCISFVESETVVFNPVWIFAIKDSNINFFGKY
jgi:hypothetical protein